MSIEKTLTERNSTHGDFAANAKISQGLKRFIYNQEGYSTLTDVQCEALDHICTKISRILSGGQNHKDNWHDIAGYATLAEQEDTKRKVSAKSIFDDIKWKPAQNVKPNVDSEAEQKKSDETTNKLSEVDVEQIFRNLVEVNEDAVH